MIVFDDDERHEVAARLRAAANRVGQDEDDSLTAWGKAIAGHRAGEQA